MQNLTKDQSENFEIHGQVLNNLNDDEKILYKYKTVQYPGTYKYKNKTTTLFAVLTIVVIIMSIYLFITTKKEINRDVSLLFMIMMPSVLIIWYYLSKHLNNPWDIHFYFTTSKIFIPKIFKRQEDIKIVDLVDIQCISFRKRVIKKDNNESGIIEIISIKAFIESGDQQAYSCNFPIKRDFSRILKMIESLLWQHSKVSQRIIGIEKELGIQIPHKFSDIKFKSQIQLFRDRIMYMSKKSSVEIEYEKEFYMNYEPFSTKSGFIILQPIFHSSIKIKFKILKIHHKLLELIYFLYLSWKNDNHLLLDVNKLPKPQIKAQIFSEELAVDKEIFDFFPINVPQEITRYFDKFLDKDEKIILTYLPERNIFKIAFNTALTILGIFSFFTFINLRSIPFSNILILVSITMLSGLGIVFVVIGPLFLSLSISRGFYKYLFTTKKIIAKRYSKTNFTFYRNISSITYDNKKKYQHIKINLKTGLEGDEPKGKRIIAINYIPLEMNLFKKIKYLKEDFS